MRWQTQPPVNTRVWHNSEGWGTVKRVLDDDVVLVHFDGKPVVQSGGGAPLALNGRTVQVPWEELETNAPREDDGPSELSRDDAAEEQAPPKPLLGAVHHWWVDEDGGWLGVDILFVPPIGIVRFYRVRFSSTAMHDQVLARYAKGVGRWAWAVRDLNGNFKSQRDGTDVLDEMVRQHPVLSRISDEFGISREESK